ncbi:MAG: FAD-dependent oxidoreductase, partial [Acidobacteria bacterium]|nr:FAD-dependent oxidoreductase [Acidobacteriota bacterium]
MSKNIAVIGAGPGGYAAAFYAADLGMQVTLIDPEANPGGVCLYRGCIPSKALLHIAKVIDEAKHAPAWGLTFGEPKIDLAKMRAFKDGVVQKLTGGNGQLVKARKVTYVQGMASFVDANTLQIDPVGSEERSGA